MTSLSAVAPEEIFCQTHSGLRFYYLRPAAEGVRIEDIAHHLSLENRFCGATRLPYSVAQHCIWVSRMVRHLQERDGVPLDAQEQLQGLLHDASEAYLKDIPAPLKFLLGEAYRRIETPVQDFLFQHFGVSSVMSPRVKEADEIAVTTEGRDLLCFDPCWTPHHPPFSDRISPLPPTDVETLYLRQFRLLSPR